MKQIKVECTPEGFALINTILKQWAYGEDACCPFNYPSILKCNTYRDCSECLKDLMVFEIKERIE